jgi:hypothetical protein
MAPLADLLERAEARARSVRAALVARTRIGQRANLAQYRYAFSPAQLWTLCDEAEKALTAAGGAVAEIGVAAGETTVYLVKHLRAAAVPLPRYIALDTFEGFTDQDIETEAQAGRDHDFNAWFSLDSQRLYAMSMRLHGIDDVVTPIRADAVTFDYASLPPIGFALVDVDLELPVSAALEGLWGRLLPGGRIVVDDCAKGTIWEGARVAYLDFCEKHGQAPDIRFEKLGLLEKPSE